VNPQKSRVYVAFVRFDKPHDISSPTKSASSRQMIGQVARKQERDRLKMERPGAMQARSVMEERRNGYMLKARSTRPQNGSSKGSMREVDVRPNAQDGGVAGKLVVPCARYRWGRRPRKAQARQPTTYHSSGRYARITPSALSRPLRSAEAVVDAAAAQHNVRSMRVERR